MNFVFVLAHFDDTFSGGRSVARFHYEALRNILRGHMISTHFRGFQKWKPGNFRKLAGFVTGKNFCVQ